MEQQSLEKLLTALNHAGVRYLICGGLAVVAHGYLRFTADVDLAVALDQDNVQAALAVLEALGYRPHLPVAPSDFADDATRAAWVAQKNMKVFSLWSPQHPATEVDIFAELPLDFEQAWRRAVSMPFAPGLSAHVVALEDLLAMKRQAGRVKDHDDITNLLALHPKADDE